MNINHGANLYELSKNLGLSKSDLLDFSSNINPLGCSLLAKKHVIDNIDMVSIYPDPNYIDLKNSISNYCKCQSENIILGNGATELISGFINNLNPNNALLISPVYSEYEKELNKIGCNIDKYFHKIENNFIIDVDDLSNTISKYNYDLVIICNPNNPTGFTFSKNDIEKLIKNNNSFFMIDETYIEFTDIDKYSSTDLVDKYNNLFVIRGTSKFFSTPGIRLGYGLLSNEKIKNNIISNLDLWNINIFSSLIGEVMFKDYNFIKESYNLIDCERQYLLNELNSIKDLKVYNTNSNFILCEIKSKNLTSAQLKNKLLNEKIIIRDCSSFEGLNEYFFRVCILKHEENKLLINSIKSNL